MSAHVSRPRDASSERSIALAGSPDARHPADSTRGGRRSSGSSPYATRALTIWPRLDAAGLARAGDDPRRIAALVARRSSLPVDVITGMLAGQAAAASRAGDPAS